MTLSFVRDVYTDGRAALSRSQPPSIVTTTTTAALAAGWPDDGYSARIASARDAQRRADSRHLLLDAGRSMPPIAAPHPRRPRVHSVVVPATLMHMPGAAWSGAACPTSPIPCSCHFGGECDMLPGASRLYHTCDGRPVA